MSLQNQIIHLVKSKGPHLALVGITMIWGTTFLLVQYGLNSSSPMFFVGCRFAAAAIAVSAISINALKKMTRHDLFAAAAIGFSITLGYGSQTVGLQYITSSESAFLTALYVPLVPLLMWVVFRKRPHYMNVIGIVMAFIGLVLLSGNGIGALSFNTGQLFTLFCALAVSVEIVLISHFAPSVNLKCVTALQLAFASLFAFMFMPILGENTTPPFSITLVSLIVGLGMASALIQLTMNWAQRSVEPSTATVIYAGEPVWAGILGRIAGERLAPLAMIGGALVVASVIVSEYRPKAQKETEDLDVTQETQGESV